MTDKSKPSSIPDVSLDNAKSINDINLLIDTAISNKTLSLEEVYEIRKRLEESKKDLIISNREELLKLAKKQWEGKLVSIINEKTVNPVKESWNFKVGKFINVWWDKFKISEIQESKAFWKSILTIVTDFDWFTIFIDAKTWDRLKLNSWEVVRWVFHSWKLLDNEIVINWKKLYCITVEKDSSSSLFARYNEFVDEKWNVVQLKTKWTNEKILTAYYEKELSLDFKEPIQSIMTENWDDKFVNANTLEEIKIKWTDFNLYSKSNYSEKPYNRFTFDDKEVFLVKTIINQKHTEILLDPKTLKPIKVGKFFITNEIPPWETTHNWIIAKEFMLVDSNGNKKRAFIDSSNLKILDVKQKT